jgi:CubicO group peptidase (beta-lactamase class C family)
MKVKFRFFAFLVILGLLFSGSGPLLAQPKNLTDAEWQLMVDRINLLVDNHFENRDYSEAEKANWNITGLSVGVYQNGRTAIFSRGYHESEQRNVRNRTPVTENSIFAIGSLSKPVSTIMYSYFSRINNPATGKPYLNLDDPVNKYFPTRPFIDTDGTAIHPTLMQFVTHYGGTPRHLHYTTLADFKSLLANLTYDHKPGTAYSYSMGAAVVANIAASLYYKDFPERRVNDLLQEHIFVPLGMNSTKLHGWVDPALKDRMTLGHTFSGAPRNLGAVKSGTLIGASGEITSTARDMMRLAAFILGDGVDQGSEILQQAAAAGIAWRTGNRSVPNIAPAPYESNAATLGGRYRELFMRPSNPGRYGSHLFHGGGIGGHYTSMIICPDTKTAVIVLVNNVNGRGAFYAEIMDYALNATYSGKRTAFDDVDDRVASYARAKTNVDVAFSEHLAIGGSMMNIKAPAKAGATLTIRSANPAKPVTLTRGTTGDLFTVQKGATLIFRDIIIDGGGNAIFSEEDNIDDDEGGNPASKPPAAVAGTLVQVNSGGTFIMESGAVLRNNVNPKYGGGVEIRSGGNVTMNGGEISGNKAAYGGGIYGNGSSAFTMTGGKISGNTAAGYGGGIYGNGTSTFTMTGGEINGNSATVGNGIRIAGTAAFNQYGGVVAGTGKDASAVVSNVSSSGHNTSGAPNNAVTIVWNKPSGKLNYTAGSSTNLTVSAGGTAVWANQGGVLGISYTNGSNTGWIRQW